VFHEIAQFVDEVPHALVAAIRRFPLLEVRRFVLFERRSRLAFTLVRCDRRRDRLIEGAVQRTEVIGFNRRIRFYRQFGNRLTHVAVVMNH
jgi:hypothetical protein